MTDNRETIEMLKMLKEQALKSHNDTAVLEVKIDSFNFVLNEAIKALEQKEKTGHWVNAKVGKLFPSNDFKCSECGNLLDFDGVNCGRGDANYCPNCGARMTESEDKE